MNLKAEEESILFAGVLADEYHMDPPCCWEPFPTLDCVSTDITR